MGRGLRRRARLLGSAVAAAVAGYSLMMVTLAPAAVQAAGCKTNPTADVAVTQSSAVGSVSNNQVTSVIFTVTGEDAGPCNASGITLTDNFSDTLAGAALAASVVSVNPSSISCAATGTAVSCGPFKLSGPSDANTNNPGNVILTIAVSGNFYPSSGAPPPISSVATINYADDLVAGNDISRGGFLLDGGDLGFPVDGAGQSTNLHVDAGGGFSGGAEIEQGVQAPACPTGVKCFGEDVLINANDILNGAGSQAVQQYVFNVPLSKSGPSGTNQVVVLHIPDQGSSWLIVPDCTATSPPAPDPCVESIVKLKTASGTFYFQITVLTEINGRWGV